MLKMDQGRTLTRRQTWWRQQRLPEVERMANELIMRHESTYGKLQGCIIQPELLLRTIGCDRVYFSDAERAEHRIPSNAIGALKPHLRLVFIYDSIQPVGREGQTIGEEIGHFVLHAEGVAGAEQQSFDFPDTSAEQTGPTFCRTETESFVDDEAEPPWMSREAAFFGACLQMPRDRYEPVAEQHLVASAKRALARRRSFESIEQRLAVIRAFIRDCRVRDYDPNADALSYQGLFDDDVVQEALDLLELDHGGKVSRAAQRRRLIELGLVHDAADVFEREGDLPAVQRWEHFFLTERVSKQAME